MPESARCYNSRMRKMLLGAALALALFAPASALANEPVVNSLTTTQTAVSYALGTQISWNTSGGSAPDFYFACAAGVTVKNGSGTIIPCNTTTTLSSSASDTAALSLVNLTGVMQTVTVRVTPVDASGTAYSDQTQTLTLNVSPVPQPLTGFSSSSNAPASGAPVTFSWTGVETPGTNLQFDCTNDIQIFTDPSNPLSVLPCGKTAFTSDLGQSGSQTVTFVNNSPFPESIGVHIFPSIVPGQYNGTQSLSLTLSVAGKTAPPVPSISSFSLSNSYPVSGSPVTLSWTAANADTANLQFSCVPSLSFLGIGATGSTTLPCGTLAFGTDLPLSGSVTVAFLSTSPTPVPAEVTLIPHVGGTYDATHGSTLSFTVDTAGSASAAASAALPASAPASTALTAPASVSHSSAASIKAIRTVTFSAALARGSRGAQVTALQQFLAEDSSLYPEGLVTGYFGPATLAAVERFQARYGVTQSGDAGYGLVGPKTRAELNSLSYF